MLYVSIAHAHEDALLARELGDYLQRNCRVELRYALVASDLLDAIGRALSDDVLIVVLSPHSVPQRPPREAWEPLLLNPHEDHGTDVAFVQAAACDFPPVLLRSNTFDARADRRECARALKRWIFELRPPALRSQVAFAGKSGAPPHLWEELVDQPASSTIGGPAEARAFAESAQQEFESVFWIDCRGCTIAEAAGEAGVRMGLRLNGTARSNLEAVRELCSRYRCLLVLEGPSDQVAAEFESFGMSSVLVVRPGASLPAVSLGVAADQLKRLTSWVGDPAAPMPTAGEVRRTVDWLIENHWDQAMPLSSAAGAYYKHHDRLAEAFEIAKMMVNAAVARRDAQCAWEFGRERQWLLESWGLRVDAPQPLTPPEPVVEQLALFA